ncbi:hypothetical protein OIU77_024131 [Salix suchowensis]|uniref:Uncharacterized protein n=1 Tax=Salix suchowensis TaxID=1278906 RepID=A0ABQ9CA08_9ROSI|nr:hypothetical protein OIU77_024131 [Salix suchowensis]
MVVWAGSQWGLSGVARRRRCGPRPCGARACGCGRRERGLVVEGVRCEGLWVWAFFFSWSGSSVTCWAVRLGSFLHVGWALFQKALGPRALGPGALGPRAWGSGGLGVWGAWGL